jgi:hypothetical protein
MKVVSPDDYQYVAPKTADWLGVSKKAETTVVRDRVAKSGAHVERLQPLGVNWIMRHAHAAASRHPDRSRSVGARSDCLKRLDI